MNFKVSLRLQGFLFERKSFMKKENILKLLSFLPLAFALMGSLFALLPFISINGNAVNIINLLSGTSVVLSVKILLGLLAILNITAAVLFIFKKYVLNNVSLVIYLLTLTTLSVLPDILVVIDETQAVSHHAGSIINIVLISLSLLFTIREFFTRVKFTIKEMVELSLLVALAIVFDFIPKIRIGATGGSISLTMLPLFIIAFRFNFVKTFIASGIVYGLLTCLFDGYGFATYPFDYLLGFGLISLTALFRKLVFSTRLPIYLQLIYFSLGILIGGFARIIGSTLSSIIIYQYTFWASITYNVAYIVPSVLFSLAILLVFFTFLKQIQRRFPVND